MKYDKIELVTDALCIVGESPLWDRRSGVLWCVDVQGKRVRQIRWSDGSVTDWVMPGPVGFLAHRADGGLLAGVGKTVYAMDDGGGLKPVSRTADLRGERINDGKAGPDGRLYYGTFSRDHTAALYRMEADGSVHELLAGVGNSNGLAWSADGTALYYNDTPTGRTDRFAFDCETGTLSGRRPLVRYAAGNPDGMCIDAQGSLWTALWGAGRVVCLSGRDGRILDEIALPVSQAACCAFAGEDLRELVITTAAHGVHLRDEPLAGATFKVRVDVPGQPAFVWKGETTPCE